MDHLVKAVAEGVRVYAAVTTDLVNEGIRRHACWPVAAAALGRTMTGALLLAANLKNKECLTVKFNGDGPLGSIVADANPEGCVRGYVGHPQVDLPLNQGKLAVGRGVGQGLRFFGHRGDGHLHQLGEIHLQVEVVGGGGLSLCQDGGR